MRKLLYTFILSLLALSLFAKKLTVNVTTAGGLSAAITAAGGNAALIDSLTVTGNIDAHDVKYMRDDMPILAVLDLEAVSIMEYKGNSGTGASYITSYPADEMPDYSFHNSSTLESKTTLTKIIFPLTIKSIGDYAFKWCDGLTGSLTIPNSITTIGEYAFYGCDGFTGSLTISSSVNSIGNAAFLLKNISNFSVDTNNPYFSSVDGILYSKDKKVLVQFPADKAQVNIVLPNTVTTIGSNAFSGCTGLTGSLTIPNSVTTIGDVAFDGCRGLTGSLTIPNSVTSIGEGAFWYCTGFNGSLTIPNSVTTIEGNAFYSCAGLTGSLTIPNSVTTIGSHAFYYCSGFTGSLTIPNSVTSIGDNAFMRCSGLTGSLTIPNSVTSIGSYAFDGCSKFNKLIVAINKPLVIYRSFSSIDKNTCILIVPMGSKTAYQNAAGWSEFKNIQEALMVMYNLNGGKADNASDTVVSLNSLIPKPSNPVRENYSFAGWYSDSTFTKTWDFSNDKVEDNVTLYAKWVNTSAVNQTNNPAFEIYPNPAITTLKLRGAQLQQISIYNLSGEVLLSKNLPGTNEAEVNISALKPGYYLLKAIDHGNTVAVKGFIKK